MMTNIKVAAQRSEATLADEVAGLFAVHRVPLLRYLLSLGLAVPVGEEVVQEVFLALFQHLRQGKSRQNLRGWLFRVGHNLALRERRRITRRPHLDLDHRQPCPEPDPEQSAASTQRHRRLLAIVRALPTQDQHCLHLRAEGLRYREIAQVLEISLGSVAMILSRALLKITQAEAI